MDHINEVIEEMQQLIHQGQHNPATATQSERCIFNLAMRRSNAIEQQQQQRPESHITSILASRYTLASDLQTFEDFYRHLGPLPATNYALTTKSLSEGYQKSNLVYRPIQDLTDFIVPLGIQQTDLLKELAHQFTGLTGIYPDKRGKGHHALLIIQSADGTTEYSAYIGATATKRRTTELLAEAIAVKNKSPDITPSNLARATLKALSIEYPFRPLGFDSTVKINDYTGAIVNDDKTLQIYQPQPFINWATQKRKEQITT